jgi:hypothetical protein
MIQRPRLALLATGLCLLIGSLTAPSAAAGGYFGAEGGYSAASVSREAQERIVRDVAEEFMPQTERFVANLLSSGLLDDLASRLGLAERSGVRGELSGSIDESAGFVRVYGGYPLNDWSAIEVGAFRSGNFNGEVRVNGGLLDGLSVPGLIRTRGLDATLRIKLGVLFLRLGGHQSEVEFRVGSQALGGEVRQRFSGSGMLGVFGVALPLSPRLSATLSAAGYQGLGGQRGVNYAAAAAGLMVRF